MQRIEFKSSDPVAAAAKRIDDSADILRVRFELKSLDAAGEFTGYASVWEEVDAIDDACVRGCFAETLAGWQARGTWPRVRWQHMAAIGHITAAVEDETGLLVKGRIWFAPVADEIRAAMAKGGVGMSFAYVAIDFEMVAGVRRITRLELMDDITLTLRPVQTSAAVLEMKSKDGTIAAPSAKILESALRDVGCSRSAARKVLACGYSGLRDAGASAEVAAGLAEIADVLRGI